MGTKNNPGNYDCYANAHTDEPMFVLLGRDPIGGALVRLWAEARETLKPGDKKIVEAQECAASMDEWCLRTAGREVHGALALLPFDMLAAEMTRRGATVTPAPHGGDFCSPATRRLTLPIAGYQRPRQRNKTHQRPAPTLKG